MVKSNRIAKASPIAGACTSWVRNKLLVVCYHGVTPDDSPVRDWLHIRRAEFEAQARFLASHFDVVPIDEGIRRLSSGTLRVPTACITFDDGYRNNATVAFPVLRALGLPATIYLATGLIGAADSLWTTRVSWSLREGQWDRIDLARWGRPPVARGERTERPAQARKVVEWLKSISATDRAEALSIIMASISNVPAVPADFALMSWDEVRLLAASDLISFGGHTVNHEILSGLTDAQVREQIEGSVGAVGALIGSEFPTAVSKTFAYPNGRPQDYDSRSRQVLRAVNVNAAVSTIPGLNRTNTDPFALRRLVIGPGLPVSRFGWATLGLPSVLTRVLGRVLP